MPGLALRFRLASWLGIGVRIGVGVWYLWLHSAFDGCILISLSPWGDSGSMMRLSWYGFE